MKHKTGIVYHPDYLKHMTGDHPECPGRLSSIMDNLTSTGLIHDLISISPRPALPEEILMVHTERHLESISSAFENGNLYLTPDTPVSRESYRVALLAAGGLMAGIDGVMSGAVDNCMALVRPPGHHATSDQAMGFCLFNNVAIAARYLQQKYHMKNILIVDWDLHHGNGTQEIFYHDPSILYFSTHQYPHYPGTGSIYEIGEGRGKGYTINVPVRAGTSSKEFLHKFSEGLYRKAIDFAPEFILISAGFDAHMNDPLGELLLTDASYSEMTGIVLDIAEQCCGGKVLSALEGGYDLDALASSVAAHLKTMLGEQS